MPVARVAAQAKINLWLRVGARDADGYHDLDTAFHRLDLADIVTIRVEESADRTLECTGPLLPSAGLGPVEENLAWRAADAFSRRAGWPRGFAIDLVKHIPTGGGLGGGSSDAAAVLRALNAMAPEPLPSAELQRLGASLGADVPFFVSDMVSAIGHGRGDRLTSFDSPVVGAAVLAVVPPFGISTADAYRWLDESRGSPSSVDEALRRGIRVVGAHDPATWTNDFEAVVERRHPMLREIRERLAAEGATLARLSGSGSSVFGLFEGTPSLVDLHGGASAIPTRASARVVQVEVQE